MRQRFLQTIPALLGLLLFVVASAVLHRELEEFSYQDVSAELSTLGTTRLALAFIFTVLSYGLLTLYDVIAIHYVGAQIPYARTALASFVGYTLSHNLGFSVFTGGAARFRLYSLWGMSATQIAQAIAFSGLMFWLGFALLSGAILTFVPLPPIKYLALSPLWFHLLGLFFLCATAALLFWWCGRKKTLRFGGWEFPPPHPTLVLLCLVVAVLDWTLAAAVAFVLLPLSATSFVQFVGVFQLSQIAGVLSHVPGGLGIFESIVALFLSRDVTAHTLVAALLTYRLTYYILPLLLACALLAAHELRFHGERLSSAVRLVQQRLTSVVPPILAFSVVASGTLLLLSGATPAVPERLQGLSLLIPLPVLELSHFAGSIIGIALVLVARGLLHRVDVAYFLALVLLPAGIAASLLKGFDYEEALLLFGVLLVFFPARRTFRRHSTLLTRPFSVRWTAAVLLIVLATISLLLFSEKHVEYSHDLWWQFSFFEDAPRSLRGTVAAACLALIWSGVTLLAPVPHPAAGSGEDDLFRAEKIVVREAHTYAALALLGDKRFLFSESGESLLMYGVEGRSWVSFGDPIGRDEETPELVWRFRELSDSADGWCVFYQVRPENLPYYVDVGLAFTKLGEEALVDLGGFSLEGKSRSSMRHVLNRFRKEGVSFRLVSDVAPLFSELRALSDAWLSAKHTREKRFSLGCFDEAYLRHFPTAVAEQGGKVVAFANVLRGAAKGELSIDLMRYDPKMHSGVMEYLLLELLLWGKAEGYQTFNLGMAPLSGLRRHELAPFWNRFGSLLFQHGEHFYNFKGLRSYKEKFDPRWEPRYLAGPGGLRLPLILANVATLISGGVRGLVSR